MSVFNKSVDVMLRRAGSFWRTDVNGECKEFYGILDDDESIEADGSAKSVIVRHAVLTVATTLAKTFAFKQVLTDEDDVSWHVHETLKEGDGALTRCVILEVE